MKKTLLLSLVLGMGLCANAEVVRTQITSTDELVAGQTYQLAAYNLGWTDGAYKWLAGGTTPSFVSDTEAASIWTLEAADESLQNCTLSGHSPMFYLKSGDEYLKIGSNALSAAMTATPDNACVFDFFSSTLDVANANKVVIGGEDTNIFGFHFYNIGGSRTATLGCNASGGFGAFSDNATTGTQMFYNALAVKWSTYYVIYKAEITDPRDAYTAQYAAAKSALENELIGDGLNQYSFSNGTTVGEWNGYATELDAAWTAETFDADVFEAVIAKINAAVGALTLNMPKDGSYIRIRTSDGATAAAGLTGKWYLGAERVTYDVIAAGTRYMTKFVDTPDASTVFYYSNGTLLNLSTGFYMSATSYNHLHPGTADVDDEGVLDNPASRIRFQAGHNSEQGVYQLITSATNNGVDRACHNHVLSGQDFTSALVTNSCGAACGVAHNINIEYVDELELAMGKDGVRSICLPVDLTVANGFEAFTAAVENDVLTLTKVDVIPANTPALLKGAAEALGTFAYTIPVAAPAEKPAATAAGDGATAVHGHTAVAQRTAAEGNKLLALTESTVEGKAAFVAVEGDVMPAHAMIVEAKEGVTEFNIAPADGAMIDLTTGQEVAVEAIEVTLNSANATASDAVSTYYFRNQTSDTDPAVTLTNATTGVRNDTGNKRFIIQDANTAINSLTVSCEKTGHYISEIEISAMDGGFNGDEFNFYMTDGSTQMTQHSASTFTWTYDYDEATASEKTIQYNKVATNSFNKNLFIYYVKVTLTKLAGAPTVDYTPITEALAAKAAILTTLKESVPGSETAVDEFIGKYAELSPEAIATQAGGVNEGVALIDNEFTLFLGNAQAKLPEWMGGKNVTLKNVRRNQYACAINAGTSEVAYNTIAEPDQTAVWQFVYEPEATECVLFNPYTLTYASPNSDGYTTPVASKDDAVEISLEIADNGRLLLYTEGYYGYLCFDISGSNMAYWLYDEGCDWQASYTDIQVSPLVGLEEINAAAADKAEVYDLLGRRVSVAAARGLYIINGHKQIVK